MAMRACSIFRHSFTFRFMSLFHPTTSLFTIIRRKSNPCWGETMMGWNKVMEPKRIALSRINHCLQSSRLCHTRATVPSRRVGVFRDGHVQYGPRGTFVSCQVERSAARSHHPLSSFWYPSPHRLGPNRTFPLYWRTPNSVSRTLPRLFTYPISAFFQVWFSSPIYGNACFEIKGLF